MALYEGQLSVSTRRDCQSPSLDYAVRSPRLKLQLLSATRARSSLMQINRILRQRRFKIQLGAAAST
jgi:hypothetical protein